MAEYQVTCVTKSAPGTRLEHITHVGGLFGKKTREDAIRAIESGQDKFYTQAPISFSGARAYLQVVTPASGSKYLRSSPDNTTTDNLLSLGSCP